MIKHFVVFLIWTLACSGGDLVLPPGDTLVEPGEATRLVKVTGDRQTGPSGTELANLLVVQLLDDNNQAIAGQAVTWLVTGGGGSIVPSAAETDADGHASARWTLGAGGSQQTATAVVSGVGVAEFTASLRKGGGDDGGPSKPSKMVISRGNGQSALVGSQVEVAPAVLVTDAQGVGVPGVRVTFSVLDGGGTVTGATAFTDPSGKAAVGSWTLGPFGGTNRLRATGEGPDILGNPLVFVATAVVTPRPDRLMFQVQPSRAAKGERLRPVQVAVVDERGAVVLTARGQIELALVGGDSKAKLQGDMRRDLVDGVAVFGDLRVNREGRDYRFRASLRGFTSIESQTFDIIDD